MNKEELKEKYGKKKVPHQWRGTDFISQMVCTFFGAGMLPKMPGTWGSLAAAVVAYPIALFSAKYEFTVAGFNVNFLIASLFIFFAPIPFIKKAMKDTQTEDPGWIVVDEVCGQWMSFSFVAPATLIAHPWLLLVGFVFFRFFDILKPLGIHKFEAFPGAWGVQSDDLLGGIYAGILVAILCFALAL
ncbi:MAG: phosphatidylglycerophosphatase A [Fibrobacter sp.]|nr:phosphatidylglycerophosphatase A [Fibrobacter sp.]